MPCPHMAQGLRVDGYFEKPLNFSKMLTAGFEPTTPKGLARCLTTAPCGHVHGMHACPGSSNGFCIASSSLRRWVMTSGENSIQEN